MLSILTPAKLNGYSGPIVIMTAARWIVDACLTGVRAPPTQSGLL